MDVASFAEPYSAPLASSFTNAIEQELGATNPKRNVLCSWNIPEIGKAESFSFCLPL